MCDFSRTHLLKKGLAINILEEKENVSVSKDLCTKSSQSVQLDWFFTSAQIGWCYVLCAIQHLQGALTHVEQTCLWNQISTRGTVRPRVTQVEAIPRPLGPPWSAWGHSLRQVLRNQTRIGCYLYKHDVINKSLCNFSQNTAKNHFIFCSDYWILSTIKIMQVSVHWLKQLFHLENSLHIQNNLGYCLYLMNFQSTFAIYFTTRKGDQWHTIRIWMYVKLTWHFTFYLKSNYLLVTVVFHNILYVPSGSLKSSFEPAPCRDLHYIIMVLSCQAQESWW